MKSDDKKPSSRRKEGEDKFATAASIVLVVCIALFLIAEAVIAAFCLLADDGTLREFMNSIGKHFGVMAWSIFWFLVVCCVASVVVRFVRFPPR